MTSFSFPLDVREILPHRDPMQLLHTLDAADAAGAVAAYTPPAGAWWEDGAPGMPAWIGIELMAQAVAAHVGFTKRLEGRPPKAGALLGTRSFNAQVALFEAGVRLTVLVRQVYMDANGLGAYDCEIRSAQGALLATAQIKVYEPDDFAQFLGAGAP